MALDNPDTVGSPAWWMMNLARRLLDPLRMVRLGTLDAYRSGCPPMLNVSDSQRKAFYVLNRVGRSNFARVIVRTPAERMAVRGIRTAAKNDDAGDEVAWRYWTTLGLDVVAPDVHNDMLTFSEGYMRSGVNALSQPVAVKCDPRFTITAQDPLNPQEALAGFQLVWDEWRNMDYAYLWLPGQQWVASRPRIRKPQQIAIPGLLASERQWAGMSPFPRLSFDTTTFTMRPDIADVDAADRDGGPYSQTYDAAIMPIQGFFNRDGVGEFEEHLDLLDRINHTLTQKVVIAAVQAFRQRVLQQDDPAGTGKDKLPATNPDTGEEINWDEMFSPGPDAMWTLPPGVSIKEFQAVDLSPILQSITDDVKHLSATTGTAFSQFSPDGANQTAEGAQLAREAQTFKIEDRDRIAARPWARVIANLFRFAPDEDRYDSDGNDRADAGRIIIDWAPAERFSLAEKAAADTQNKSLSADMAAVKIWGLTQDEAAINKAQRASDVFAAAVLMPQQQPQAPVVGR